MMKKGTYIISLLLITLSATVAYADTASSTHPLPPKDIRSPFATNRLTSSTTPSIKEQMRQRQDNIVRAVYKKETDVVNMRIGATIDRLSGIMALLNSRIEKIKNAGGNTTAAETLVLDAKTNLDTAKNLFATLMTNATNLSTESTASSTESVMKGLRKSATDIEKTLQKAHKDLEDAVKSLRDAMKPAGTASTTRTNQ